MRIAIFEPYIEGIGGAQKVIAEYVFYLKNKGHEIEIFTQRYNPKFCYSKFKNLKITILKPSYKNLAGLTFLRKIKNFDIYITNDFPSNFISIRNKPVVWVCYSPKRDFYDLKDFYFRNASVSKKIVLIIKKILFKRIDKLSAKKTEMICPISRTIQERVKKYYSQNTDHIFYSGIHFDEYYSGEYKDYFLVVSRLVKPKRIDLAIKAMDFVKNKKIKLYIVGGGPEKENLQKIAEKNNKIKFFGEVDDIRLKELYANCRGVIFTPIREDWGLIPLEAAASKKATIGVNEGGLRETIINKKTGFLIKDITPKKLAEKMDILFDLKLAKEMGEKAFDYCKKFDWKNLLPDFEKKLYNLHKSTLK